MTATTITLARKNLYKLVEQANTSHQPVHLVGKNGGAVMVSEDDWSAMQETLHLCSIPGMRESIIEGMKTPVKKCAAVVPW